MGRTCYIGSSPTVKWRVEEVEFQVQKCRQFIDIQENKAFFVHASAREYLLRYFDDTDADLVVFEIRAEEAHGALANACLMELQKYLDATEMKPSSDIYGHSIAASYYVKLPPLRYALKHWNCHDSSAKFRDVEKDSPWFSSLNRVHTKLGSCGSGRVWSKYPSVTWIFCTNGLKWQPNLTKT
jgi:hypothetical protein